MTHAYKNVSWTSWRRSLKVLLVPELKTHKLHGQLEGLWACWVEYDCRIVFAFEPDPAGGEDVIVLVDIGSHDEVY